MANSSTDNGCPQLEALASAWYLHTVLALKLAANSLAALLLLVHKLQIVKGHPAMFHPNTVVIYNFFLASTLGIALNSIPLFGFDLLRLFFVDPCLRVWPVRLILPIRLLNSTFIYGQDGALLVLCAERLLCVCRLHDYEGARRSGLVLALLLAITMAISVPFGCLSWMRVSSMADTSTTSYMQNQGPVYQMSLYFMAVVELLVPLALLSIHRWALARRRLLHRHGTSQQQGQHSGGLLSVKFQLEETVRVSALFLPVTLTKFATFQFSLGVLTLINKVPSLVSAMKSGGLVQQIFVSEAASIGYFQPLITALLLLHGHGQLTPLLHFLGRLLCRPCLKGQCDWRSSNRNRICPNEVLPTNSQEAHFKQLDALFEKGIPI